MLPIPLLIIIDIAIWRQYLKNIARDKQSTPGPDNPNYDIDMDNLYSEKGWKIPKPKKIDLGTHAYLEELGWYEPEDTIWVEGYELFPGDIADMETFMKIKDQAYLNGIFEDIPLDGGGKERLYYKWFLMLGASPYGAERLVEQKILPWEL
jgi:hypothetical protein